MLSCGRCRCGLLGIDILYRLPDVIHGNNGKDRTENLANFDNAQVSEQFKELQAVRGYTLRGVSRLP